MRYGDCFAARIYETRVQVYQANQHVTCITSLDIRDVPGSFVPRFLLVLQRILSGIYHECRVYSVKNERKIFSYNCLTHGLVRS